MLAVTPVAALMFRFNNPDALLVLLLVAGWLLRDPGGGSTVRPAGWHWSGALIGFGFLTKMLQALLVVPAFALVYLVAAPNPLRQPDRRLLLAGAAMVVVGGLVDRHRVADPGAGTVPTSAARSTTRSWS